MLYAKFLPLIEEHRREFGLPPNLSGFSKKDERGAYKLVPVDGPGDAEKGNPYYTFLGVTNYFRFSKETMEKKYHEGLIVKAGQSLQQKYYLEDAAKSRKTDTTWWDQKYYTSTATSRLNDLLGGKYFDNPKPVELIERMLQLWVRDDGDFILDFFAGSGTTAHAVLNLNQQDGIDRKFIMVQLPELTSEGSAAWKAGYNSIADIGKERVRRVTQRLTDDENGKFDVEGAPQQDRGFKVFKLTSSNFKIWDGARASEEPEDLAEQLRAFAENVLPDRSREAILYEILLKSGLPLAAEVERLTVAGREVYAISGGLLMVCLEDHVDEELVRGVVELEPQRFVCLDTAFNGNDKLKTNAVLQMKDHGIEFRTV